MVDMSGQKIGESQAELLDGISVIRGGGDRRNWNGIHYKEGLSGKNVGAKNLSINIATGFYWVSALGVDSATATLRAVYAGVPVDKIFTISKSRVAVSRGYFSSVS